MPISRSRWLAAITPALLLAGAAPLHAHEGEPSGKDYPAATAADKALLRQAIDIHSHLDPDSFGPHSAQMARSLDIIDMARRAEAAGMRGFLIKQHYDQTAQLAYLANKVVPGVEIFGQLSLNLTVGGLNPAAVHHFAEVKGGRARIVSMPTWDSENNIRHSQTPNNPFVRVSKDGALLPETKAVIAAIATAKVRDTGVPLALSTGHLSPAEALMVIREAKKQGVARIIVTHAIAHPIEMSLAQMKEAAGLGAFIEFAAGFLVGERSTFTTQQYVDAMRAIGLDHVILSSDSGQVGRAPPDEMIAMVAGQLRAKGLSTADLRKIMVENPATLLGIPQPAG
jgi:predicted TIM-barrel fold metal-dependent hydrolase